MGSLIRFAKPSRLEIVFFILIVTSLCIKWIFLIHVGLDSDTVHPALLSRDIKTYGFQVLEEYRLPSDDPYLFSDSLPFHLPIQFLTGFSLLALKISSFLIYILIIGVFSLVVFFMTGNRTAALAFAAFFAALPPSSSLVYMTPIFHNGTILWIGVLLLLSLHDKGTSNYAFVFYLIIIGLVVFSDSIIIMWFLLPIYTTYILFDREDLLKNKYAHALVFLTAGTAFLVKKIFIPQFRHHTVSFIWDPAGIFQNILILFKNYLYLYNDIFFSLSSNWNVLIASIILILSSISLYDIIRGSDRNIPILHIRDYTESNTTTNIDKMQKKKSNLQIALLLFFAIPSLIYILSDYAALGLLRYLSFPFLTVLLILFIHVKIENPRTTACILLLILINTGMGIGTISSMDLPANADSYQFIDFLDENNLTYGYGDYWDANLITYLSSGTITIRPIIYKDSDIYPFEWLTCDCWYKHPPSEFFLLVGERNSNLLNYSLEFPPSREIKWKNYTIYYYSNHTLPHISSFDYVTFDEKVRFIMDKIQ